MQSRGDIGDAVTLAQEAKLGHVLQDPNSHLKQESLCLGRRM